MSSSTDRCAAHAPGPPPARFRSPSLSQPASAPASPGPSPQQRTDLSHAVPRFPVRTSVPAPVSAHPLARCLPFPIDRPQPSSARACLSRSPACSASAQPATVLSPAQLNVPHRPLPARASSQLARARTLPPTDRAGPPVSAPPWQPARQQPNSPSPPGSRNGAQRSPIPGPRVGLSSMPSGPRASIRALTPLRRHLGPTPSASPCSVPRRINQRPLLSLDARPHLTAPSPSSRTLRSRTGLLP